MRYFIDTEFQEGFHKPLFGKRRHFIDLISIGIVAEDGREYYAISKDFDLKTTWNKYDLEPDINEGGFKKVYWLRDNVLKPIVAYLDNIERKSRSSVHLVYYSKANRLINKYGKSNKQIAEEITKFVSMDYIDGYGEEFTSEVKCDNHYIKSNPEFYGYYADYDWVLFCSLFGRMIDLPAGFPMYFIDLKQMLDYKVKTSSFEQSNPITMGASLENRLNYIKLSTEYPKQGNEHNALQDAIFNRNLYNFLKTI